MPTGNSGGALQIGEWIVNPSLDTIAKGSDAQKLEPRTMRLLMCLANSAGEVVRSASVYQAVSQLRKLLGDVDPIPTYIVNVPRKGYRLIAPVRKTEAASEIAAAAQTPAAETRVVEPPIVVPPPPARKRLATPLILGGVALIVLLATAALL